MSDDNDQKRSFEDKVQDKQDAIEAQFRKISRGSWARIIRMARKPTPQEFKQTSIICGIGLFVLGFIGFVRAIPPLKWTGKGATTDGSAAARSHSCGVPRTELRRGVGRRRPPRRRRPRCRRRPPPVSCRASRERWRRHHHRFPY